MEKTYEQIFKGYFLYTSREFLPETSGIYCVYAGTYNKNKNEVSIRKLLYIGQSENINKRLEKHECYDKWIKHLQYGESIIFSYTDVSEHDLDRFEAAMIYEHKPPVNIEYVNQFPFDTTYVYTSGENILLKNYFVIKKSTTKSPSYVRYRY